MDSDSCHTRLSTSSKRYQSRPDLFFGGGHDEIDVEEDSRAEFLCPFCAEDYDVVGLCCHIDEEHPREAKNGVCPICAKRVGMDIVGHVTTQHGSFLKALGLFSHVSDCFATLFSNTMKSSCDSLTSDHVQRKRRFRKGGSNSTFSQLRKELREGNLQIPFGGGSSCIVSSNTEPDPLLLSFMYNARVVDESVDVQSRSLVETSSVHESSKEDFLERTSPQTMLSDEDQEEKTRKCEFVRGLLLSTILDDNM